MAHNVMRKQLTFYETTAPLISARAVISGSSFGTAGVGFGVSREHVWQIHVRALDKVQKAIRDERGDQD
jgi:hypothetical protein